MRSNKIAQIRLPFFVITALFLIGCEREKKEVTNPSLRQVRSVLVESGDGVLRRSFSGSLRSSNETSYSFRVSGTIRAIPVEIGQSVRKGETIATLDPSDYELAVQKSEASLTEAKSEERNAKADYGRTKKLYEAGNSSRNDLDNARAASETATAATLAARKSLQIAQRDLSYTRLMSQANCKIAGLAHDSGENVQQGEEVVSATCGEDLEVELDIPESFIGNIKRDMKVQVSFPAIPDKTYDGSVKEVGVSAISGGTTFPVDILITTPEKQELKSGLSANVSFSIEKQGSDSIAPVLPSFAVGEDQDGRFVFVVEVSEKGDTTVKRRPVEIGAIEQNGIAIISGVEPGMRVVIAGVSVLRDGMEVTAVQQ